ncbi:protein-ER retention protein, partial [Borealophlyctis nickersoniae]
MHGLNVSGGGAWSYRSVYGLATGFTIATLISLWVFSDVNEKLGEEDAEYVPTLTYFAFVALTLCPLNIFFRAERMKFLRSVKRIILDGLWSEVPFCDVILADILTSFSRVLGDLQPVFYDLALDGSTAEIRHSSIWQSMSPLLICLPFLFRLRQCISEYNLSHDHSARRRHFANAVKYATSLPVVLSSFAINFLRKRHQREIEAPGDINAEEVEAKLNFAVGIWIFFATINSLYSLYWDIRVDWALFQPRSRHTFLRSHLHFSRSPLYYLAMILDTLLRLTWTAKVALLYRLVRATVYQDAMPSSVGVDVGLKVLEVLRRWMWVFFRIEREWVEEGS